jgi:hypothetical protein
MFEAPGELASLLGLVAAGALVVSGLEHVTFGRERFAEVLYQQRLVSSRFQPLVARAVPLAEMVVGIAAVLALSSPMRMGIFGIAAATYCVYAIYLILVVRSGRRVGCGCLSAATPAIEATSVWHVTRAVVLAAMALTASATPPVSLPWQAAALATLLVPATVLLLAILPSFIEVERQAVRGRLARAGGVR